MGQAEGVAQEVLGGRLPELRGLQPRDDPGVDRLDQQQVAFVVDAPQHVALVSRRGALHETVGVEEVHHVHQPP